MSTSTKDPSWKSLYKSGAVTALLAGAFLILSAITQAIIHSSLTTYTRNTLANTSNTFLTIDQFLLFVWNNAILYRTWYFSIGLTALSSLPVFLTLYIVLRDRDKGRALMGSALGILGIGVLLANLGDHFFLVDEAINFQNGCTPCAASALAGASATGAANIADIIGGIVFALAVIVLSRTMFMGPPFQSKHGALGLVAGVYTIIGGVLLGINGDIFYYPGLVLYFLLAAWFFAVGLKLYDLK